MHGLRLGQGPGSHDGTGRGTGRRSARRLNRNRDRRSLLKQPRERIGQLHVHLLRRAIVPSERGLPSFGMTHSSCAWAGSDGIAPVTARISR